MDTYDFASVVAGGDEAVTKWMQDNHWLSAYVNSWQSQVITAALHAMYMHQGRVSLGTH